MSPPKMKAPPGREALELRGVLENNRPAKFNADPLKPASRFAILALQRLRSMSEGAANDLWVAEYSVAEVHHWPKRSAAR